MFMIWPYPQSISEVKAYIDKGEPDCGPDERVGAEVELRESAICRPDDVWLMFPIVRAVFCRTAEREIRRPQAFGAWRIAPEEDVHVFHRILSYAPDGPHRDIYTDQPCTYDDNWRRIVVYGRFYRRPGPQQKGRGDGCS